MNTCANLAGGIAPISTAYIATKFGWIMALDFAALVSFCGGLIWVFVNAEDNSKSAGKGVLRRCILCEHHSRSAGYGAKATS